METIDLTPTWSGVLPALLLVVATGTDEGRKMACDELAHMAHAADKCNEAHALLREIRGRLPGVSLDSERGTVFPEDIEYLQIRIKAIIGDE